MDVVPKYVCTATDFNIYLYFYKFDIFSFSFCLIYIDNISDVYQSFEIMV